MKEFFENEKYYLEDKLRLLVIIFLKLNKISEPHFDHHQLILIV